MYLLWNSPNQIIYEGLSLILLEFHKLLICVFGNFQEGITGHVHHSGEFLFHELKQFFDHCLQEVPIALQEVRILPDNIHNAACHYSLILFTLFGLT